MSHSGVGPDMETLAARARGHRGGRPTVMTPPRLAEALRMREEGATLDYIAGALQVSRASVVRAVGRAEKAARECDDMTARWSRCCVAEEADGRCPRRL